MKKGEFTPGEQQGVSATRQERVNVFNPFFSQRRQKKALKPDFDRQECLIIGQRIGILIFSMAEEQPNRFLALKTA